MAWQKLIMTEQRIKARESEKRYRQKKRYLQSNKTPEQQEQYRQMWRKYTDKNREKKRLDSLDRYYKNRNELLEKAKQYHRNNPEVNLRNGQKYLERLGIELGILTKDVKRVLMSWKRTIQKRDKNCQICGGENDLQAHHILYREYYPKLTLNTNNGILLCRQHHYETHGWVMVK